MKTVQQEPQMGRNVAKLSHYQCQATPEPETMSKVSKYWTAAQWSFLVFLDESNILSQQNQGPIDSLKVLRQENSSQCEVYSFCTDLGSHVVIF